MAERLAGYLLFKTFSIVTLAHQRLVYLGRKEGDLTEHSHVLRLISRGTNTKTD